MLHDPDYLGINDINPMNQTIEKEVDTIEFIITYLIGLEREKQDFVI